MSKINDTVKLAFDKGYRVNAEGNVVSPSGRIRKCTLRRRENDTRLWFTVNTGQAGFVRPIPVHKLQAYQKFGEELFAPGIVARHLDGDALDNRPENIAIGTASDNMLDRPVVARKEHAAHAASHNIAHDWKAIEADYRDNGLGFGKLSAKYKISRSTLSAHFNKIPGWRPKETALGWAAIRQHLSETGDSYKVAAAKFNTSDRVIRRALGPQTK